MSPYISNHYRAAGPIIKGAEGPVKAEILFKKEISAAPNILLLRGLPAPKKTPIADVNPTSYRALRAL